MFEKFMKLFSAKKRIKTFKEPLEEPLHRMSSENTLFEARQADTESTMIRMSFVPSCPIVLSHCTGKRIRMFGGKLPMGSNINSHLLTKTK